MSIPRSKVPASCKDPRGPKVPRETWASKVPQEEMVLMVKRESLGFKGHMDPRFERIKRRSRHTGTSR